MKRIVRTLAVLWIAALVSLAAVGCKKSSDDDAFWGLSGTVSGAEGTALSGATVYLVPTSAVDTTQITASGVFTAPYPAEAYDEPLEDAVAASGASFPQALTGASGSFSIGTIPDGSYFVYVAPPVGDTEHLPGGDKCRNAYDASQLKGATLAIKVSSSPSPAATYVGMSSCLGCHPDHDTAKYTAHKIGIMPMSAPGAQQSAAMYPDYFNAFSKFKSAADYTGGTRLELGDYDSTRGFDKFKIREFGDTQMPISAVYLNLYLWKSTGNGKYYITIDNMLNGADPLDLTSLEVRFTYGGAVYKQRYLLDVSPLAAGRTGLYFTLQYNTEGSTSRWDRARRVWRDYKFSNFWGAGTDTTYGTADDVIKAPPVTQTFQGECAACHFTGYERYTAANGEFLARAANNLNGEADVDDDVGADEMNITCETCHGAGSEHAAANSARYIVAQDYLSPERQNTTCGRCHDRPNGKTGNEQPISDVTLRMMPPGQSRATFLADYCQTAKKGPNPASEVWADGIHSKSHHQQYSDFIKSGHYKNDRKLVVCGDCHNMHAVENRHSLKYDLEDNNSLLCQQCHNVDTQGHLLEHTGSTMAGLNTRCVDCHMTKTAQTGSGRYGLMTFLPPYASSADEEAKTYWESDISSHTFKVPRKTGVDVAGKAPGKAMPIPYTNSCGACHDVSQLQYP